jgi:hypothetical protein
MSAGGRRLTVAAVAATLLPACSTEAILHRRGDPPLQARILRSDSDLIAVRTETGATLAIRRDDVTDIDHPGNVLAIAGACVLAVAASIAMESETRGELLTTGAIVGLPGAVMLTWGGVVYQRSRNAAARFTQETVRLQTPDPGRPYLPAPTWPVGDPPAPVSPVPPSAGPR